MLAVIFVRAQLGETNACASCTYLLIVSQLPDDFDAVYRATNNIAERR